MSACRSCAAPIVWVTTSENKWLPVDEQPVSDGNVLLEGGNPPRAKVLIDEQLAKARTAQVRLYQSHFRSCPNAARHRKATAA